MSDDVIAAYRGYRIKLDLTQLQGGGWTGTFTLIRDGGDEINYVLNTEAPPSPLVKQLNRRPWTQQG